MCDEQRYPYAAAIAVAQLLANELRPTCDRIEIAGSLRRRKAFVGDIEIVYIPRTVQRPPARGIEK